MLKVTLPKRIGDDFGSGEFHASRGSRRHKGIDYACYPQTRIESLTDGKVTKLGYPYADDLTYRYVEITDEHGNRHRYFYVEPYLDQGDVVKTGEVIGEAQDIAGRYNEPPKVMLNHVHYEILHYSDGLEINPEDFHG